MDSDDTTAFRDLIGRYKADPESVYNTWFVEGDARLKAFRAIRRGVQDLLIKIGRALNCDVFVARNDRHRCCDGQSFAQLTIPQLPPTGWPREVADTVSLIDVIWLGRQTGGIVAAFEVEKSTSVYSGILRLEDLARSIPGLVCDLYLVAPDAREKEVMAQLARPAFRNDLSDISLAFIPFSDLCHRCDGLCTFGEDHPILRKIARRSPLD